MLPVSVLVPLELTRSSVGVLNRYFQSPVGSIKMSTHDSAS
jgi:hypothetical protein